MHVLEYLAPHLPSTGTLVGLLVAVVAYQTGFLRIGRGAPAANSSSPPPPTRRSVPASDISHARRASVKELAVQQKTCAEVKARCLPAAAAVKKLHDEGGSVDELRDHLAELVLVLNEQQVAGAAGVIATTELCNALLESDALASLQLLQEHPDKAVKASAAELFENVIPRIWSF